MAATIFDILNQQENELQKNNLLRNQSQGQAISNAYAPQQAASQYLQNQKQAMVNRMLDQNPVLAMSQNLPPGAAGQYTLANILRQSNNPQFQKLGDQISGRLDLENKSQEALINKNNIYATNKWYSDLPSAEKLKVNQQLQEAGWTNAQLGELFNTGKIGDVYNLGLTPQQYYDQQGSSISANPLSSEKSQQQSGQSQGVLSKGERTTTQINRAGYGKNAETTLTSIENVLPQISNYAGGAGKLQATNDELASLIGGKPSGNYNAYNIFKNTLVPQFVSQLTQFYGTSIQPEVREHLEGEFSPKATETKEQYLSRVDTLSKVLRAELAQQSQNAAEVVNGEVIAVDPNESIEKVLGSYGGQDSSKNIKSSSGKMVRVKAPNGKIYEMSSADADMAVKEGGGSILG